MFEVMVDSFQMVRSEVSTEILQAALLRGREVLGRKPPQRLADHLDPEAYLLVRRGGRDLGYARIREFPEIRNGKSGARVSERGWMFFPDSTYHYIMNDYYVSDDFNSGVFEMRLRVVTPASEERLVTVMDQLERGIRENDKLILSYTVPLKEPELYAFSSYNSTRKGLVLRTFRVCGPQSNGTGDPPAVAFKVEDSEGMVPPVSEMFLDDRGFVRKIVAGQDTVLRTTKKQVEYLFGQRVRQAREQLTGLGLQVED
jgi:hypothetical protein